jgi:hypothetical protein
MISNTYIRVFVFFTGSIFLKAETSTLDQHLLKDDRAELAEKYHNRVKRYFAGNNVYVTGEVKIPSTINIEQRAPLNLKAVISLSGGYTDNASKHWILIIRDHQTYKIMTEIGDLDKIFLDGGDLVFIPHKVYIGR